MREETKEHVLKFLNEQREKQQKEENAKKTRDLIEWGFYELKPCEEKVYESFYSEKHKSYVKRVALDITDEYYEQIKAYKLKDRIELKQVIRSIAYAIFILGTIIGLLSSRSTSPVLTMISIFASSFVSGVIFLGFAKIIELLEEIREHTKNK